MIRFFDILFSLIGLAILSPVFFILSLWIFIDSTGSVIYKQKRVGRNGVDFFLFKFRSMHVDADREGLITIGKRDPRITNSGYFTRKFKLDELPQLLNVFIGDMSLVGPRPEVRRYVNLYTKEQMKVLSIRPGITDYASIQFRNENEILSKAKYPDQYYIEQIMPEKLKLNMIFIEKQNLCHYFKIIILTFGLILQKN